MKFMNRREFMKTRAVDEELQLTQLALSDCGVPAVKRGDAQTHTANIQADTV